MFALAIVLVALVRSQAARDAGAAPPSPVATLRVEAQRVGALVQCRGTRAFLSATKALPEVGERSVLYDAKARAAVTPEQHARLAAEEQARFELSSFPPEFYYSTRYGTPLAYARLLDLVGQHSGAPTEDALSAKRILDFGYGGIGHLRLLASLGCDAVGVDVDSLLAVYYGPEDQGAIAGFAGGPAGKLTLVQGSWPGDERVKRAVGGGFDLILSKNTLKKGYVRPAQEVDPRMLVELGVTPGEFLAEVARALEPGGIFALYNICPAPRTDRYVPWAYGESPFTREEFAAAGFELLAFDVNDRAQVVELGFALGWEEQGQDLEHDLFAWYTLARRKTP